MALFDPLKIEAIQQDKYCRIHIIYGTQSEIHDEKVQERILASLEKAGIQTYPLYYGLEEANIGEIAKTAGTKCNLSYRVPYLRFNNRRDNDGKAISVYTTPEKADLLIKGLEQLETDGFKLDRSIERVKHDLSLHAENVVTIEKDKDSGLLHGFIYYGTQPDETLKANIVASLKKAGMHPDMDFENKDILNNPEELAKTIQKNGSYVYEGESGGRGMNQHFVSFYTNGKDTAKSVLTELKANTDLLSEFALGRLKSSISHMKLSGTNRE